MTFSGPIPPANRGTAVASGRIHLSDELVGLQSRMKMQIELVSAELAAQRLPVASWAPTPLWFVPVGDVPRTIEIGRRLLDDGFFVNVSAFPAVPHGMAGVRFTHTLANPADVIVDMITRLGHHHRQVVGEREVYVDITALESDTPAEAGRLPAQGSRLPPD